jgi:hypothetical protein
MNKNFLFLLMLVISNFIFGVNIDSKNARACDECGGHGIRLQCYRLNPFKGGPETGGPKETSAAEVDAYFNAEALLYDDTPPNSSILDAYKKCIDDANGWRHWDAWDWYDKGTYFCRVGKSILKSQDRRCHYWR